MFLFLPLFVWLVGWFVWCVCAVCCVLCAEIVCGGRGVRRVECVLATRLGTKFARTLRVGKLSGNGLFGGRNIDKFDPCRPPGN